MTARQRNTGDLMSDLQQLLDIEAIKRLKARYLRYGDTRDWDRFAELFTPDYEVEVDGVPRPTREFATQVRVQGLDSIMAAWRSLLVGITSAHQAVLPEIEITGPNTATGIWALHETVWFPKCTFNGWGHYFEDYLRVDGVWKIKRTRTTRLKVEEQWLD
jgi:SnoaL-like domain